MPTFLTRSQLYRMIQRELPEDAYPDGSPSAYFSTADSDATAQNLASAYANLETVYKNYFPQETVERIDDWEITMLGKKQSPNMTLAERRALVVAQWRAQPRFDVWTLLTGVLERVPEGTVVQLHEKCEDIEAGGWELGESLLGFDTFLGDLVRTIFQNSSDYCSVDQLFEDWHLGISELGDTTTLGDDSFLEYFDSLNWGLQQVYAYSYEVRIFNYTLSAAERTAIDNYLRTFEPARSQHFITDNRTFEEFELNTVVTDIDQFDNVNCAYKDALSSTGYSGRIEDAA